MTVPSSRTSRLVFLLFIAALWTPLIAVMLSPAFPSFLRQIRHDSQSFEAERNRLRQATPLWNAAVAFYNRSLYAFGVSGRPGAAEVGRHGWIFLGDIFSNNFAQATGRRVLDDAEVSRWTTALALQGNWLAARHIPYAFVVAPAKWSVYPEYLPRWTRGLEAVHSFDRVLAADRSLPLVDLRPALREAKTRGATYSALDSHWTDYGAWVAWSQVAAALKTTIPMLPAIAVPALRSTHVTAGNNEFEGMLGIAADNPVTGYELAEPLSAYAIVNPDGSTQTMPGGSKTDFADLPRATRNDSATNRLRVLVLRDSTGNALSPLLQNAFFSTYQVDHSLAVAARRPNLPGLVEAVQPDLVLWIMTERYFNEPLADLGYWHSAATFDCNAHATLGIWPQSTKGALTVRSDTRSGQPLTLALEDTVNEAVIVRVALQAGAAGTLSIALASDAAGARVASYVKGRNELYLEFEHLPVETALRVSSDASTDIREIEIRLVKSRVCATSNAASQ